MLQKIKQNIQNNTQKLLVKMGKAEQTQDTEFEEKAAMIQKLSDTAKSMRRSLENTNKSLKETHDTALTLAYSFNQVMPTDNTTESFYAAQQQLQHTYGDIFAPVVEQCIAQLSELTKEIEKFKKKIDERNKLIVEFDSNARKLNNLKQNDNNDVNKWTMATETYAIAKDKYEKANTSLKKELDQFYKQRTKYFDSSFTSIMKSLNDYYTKAHDEAKMYEHCIKDAAQLKASIEEKKQSNGIAALPVFGQPIIVGLRGNSICPVVVSTIYYLEKNGIDEEGITRLSGSNDRIQEYVRRFDRGEEVDFSDCKDPHIVSGLLKQYLRELPETIIPNEIATRLSEKDLNTCKVDEIQNELSQMPEPNLELLDFVLSFLKNIVAHSDKNKMNLGNIITIFSPSMKISGPILNSFITRYNEVFVSE